MSGSRHILVCGAGILGLWQALKLAEAGFAVTLCDASDAPHTQAAASRYAGAMLAPWCEAEAAPDLVRDLGIAALDDWRAVHPGIQWNGSLVIAPARDRSELVRFSKQTTGHRLLNEAEIGDLEPALAGRFTDALLFPDEAHMAADMALLQLLDVARARGCKIALGRARDTFDETDFARVVDATGLAARAVLPELRGVRGERVVVRCVDVSLLRPVRLLHPRHPIYIVPWPDQRFVIGATVIENEEAGPASVRSVLELLGAAYAVHPGFADAELLDVGAGVRPSFPDHVPRVMCSVNQRTLYVNGAYRHGFLLAPALADATLAVITNPPSAHPLLHLPVGAQVLKGDVP